MALYTTTLLQMVQTVAERVGLPSPSTVIGNTDPQVVQLKALFNQAGKLLVTRHDWTSLITETTFTTVALNLQGTLTSVASAGFKHYIKNTMWNRTTQQPVQEIDERGWQLWRASAATGPYPRFRIQNNSLYFIPAPTAGHTVAFEYQDRRWCMDSTEATKREAFADDDDLSRVDPELLLLDVEWRWKKQKGFEYAEDFNTFEREVMNAIARDAPKLTLSMDNGGSTPAPGVTVPEGSWNLP